MAALRQAEWAVSVSALASNPSQSTQIVPPPTAKGRLLVPRRYRVAGKPGTPFVMILAIQQGAGWVPLVESVARSALGAVARRG